VKAQEITVGAHADHQDSHYRFPRQRADRLYVPLEKSASVFITRGDMIALAGLAIFAVAAFVVPTVIVAAVH
jgi:hypothetical protein